MILDLAIPCRVSGLACGACAPPEITNSRRTFQERSEVRRHAQSNRIRLRLGKLEQRNGCLSTIPAQQLPTFDMIIHGDRTFQFSDFHFRICG